MMSALIRPTATMFVESGFAPSPYGHEIRKKSGTKTDTNSLSVDEFYFNNADAGEWCFFNHSGKPMEPPPRFARDYGFFSPTALNWLEEPLTIAEGEKLRLLYRVVVHGGSTDEAEIERLYYEYADG